MVLWEATAEERASIERLAHSRTDLAECRKYPVVRIARMPDEWVERLREAVRLRSDSAHTAELLRTARENTWMARAQQIVAALEARKRRDGTPVLAGQAEVVRGSVSRSAEQTV